MSGRRKLWTGTLQDWMAEHERQMRVRFMQVGSEPASVAAQTWEREIVAEHTESALKWGDISPRLWRAQYTENQPGPAVTIVADTAPFAAALTRYGGGPRPAQLSLVEQRLAALGFTQAGQGVWVAPMGGVVTLTQLDTNVITLAPQHTEQHELVEVLCERR